MRELLKNTPLLLTRRQTGILSAASVITATYALSNLIGLVKTRLLLAQFFGSSSSLLDVYYAAFVIPDTIFQLLVIGSLSAAFIPIFTKLLDKHSHQAWQVASSSLNLVLLAFFLMSLFIFIFATPLSRLIAPGFSSHQISVMSDLLRVMLIAQLFFAVSAFLTSIIQSHDRFLIPALAPVAYNLGIIAGTVFLSPSLGIFGPALGVVIGSFLHVLIQLPLAWHLGFRFSLSLNLSLPGVSSMIRLMPPRALALGIDQIEHFISVILASLLSSGSLSLFNISRLLHFLPSTLFGATIGQAALPTLARLATLPDRSRFNRVFTESLLQIAFLALPLSVLFIVLRIPIVRLVFGTKSFPWVATLLTGKTLAILSLSAGFTAVMQLVVRGFYSLHDTRTPLLVGLAAAVFDAFLGFVAVTALQLGIPGLAVAVSATAVLETSLLYFLLSRRLSLALPLIPMAKIATISLITGFSLWLPMRLLDRFVFDTTRTIPLLLLTLITGSIGLLVYFLLSYFFRVEELRTFLGLFRKFANFRSLVANHPPEPVILSAPDQN